MHMLRGSARTLAAERGTLFGRAQWRRGLASSSVEERKRQLVEDVKGGYLADFHEFRKNVGKRSEAPDTLCSRREAVAFPSMAGCSLAGHELELPGATRGAPSLILMSMRAYGMKMCNLYRRPFEEEFGGHSSVKVFEVSLVERTFFKTLHRWMERNLKSEIPSFRHAAFMVYAGGQTKKVKKTLSLGNPIVAYAFLLDDTGHVRWQAHATPTEQEERAMIRCTRQLLEEN